MHSLPLLHLIDSELRQLRLLCERYWNRGGEGRAVIYKMGTVQVPFMASPVAAEGAEQMATGAEHEGSNEGLDQESDLADSDSDAGMSKVAVSYESLSLGPDFPDFFTDGYHSIMVRKEYRDMLQHISNLYINGRRGVVVTGTPGIGENIV
jgi:hypothetical protein